MTKKTNVPLVVGLSIPVLMIVFVAASIYLPRLFLSPQTNFLFVTGFDSYSRNAFSVENGKLVKLEIKYPETYKPNSQEKFYFYDVKADESKEISFSAAQELTLDSSSKSPDGYEVAYGDNPDGIFALVFDGWRNRNTLYLKGKGGGRAIKNPTTGRPYNQWNMQFVGWIISEKE